MVNKPLHAILLQIGYFERGLSKRFKIVNFIFLSNRILSVCHSHIPECHPYVTLMYSHFILMSLVCTGMSSVCHTYVLACHPYVTRASSVCIRMSSVCHSYVLVCHPYGTRIYAYIIRMSLVCGFTMNHIKKPQVHFIIINIFDRKCKTPYGCITFNFYQKYFYEKTDLRHFYFRATIWTVISYTFHAKLLS